MILERPRLFFQAPRQDPNFDDFYSGSNEKIHVGDFDWDERDDLLCEMAQGSYKIGVTDGDGLLVNEDWRENFGWVNN